MKKMFALFIAMFVFTSFIGKCDGMYPNSNTDESESNSVERMMIGVCVEVFGITKKPSRWAPSLITTGSTLTHGFKKFYGKEEIDNEKEPLEEAIRLHVFLKTVAGTTEEHRGYGTIISYLNVCYILVERFKEFTAQIVKEMKAKETMEKEKIMEMKKSLKGKNQAHSSKIEIENSSRHGKGPEIETKDAVSDAASKNVMDTVLKDVGLAKNDWQRLSKAMPPIKWKGKINLTNLLSGNTFEFGYTKQTKAEEGMLNAFKSVIQNSPEIEWEEKKKNLKKLCLEIVALAHVVYEKDMKEKKMKGEEIGELFCEKIMTLELTAAVHGQHSEKQMHPSEQSSVVAVYDEGKDD